MASTLVRLPREGSIGLFTRGQAALPVSVPSHSFSLRRAISSAEQASSEAQKLAGLASVKPYDSR